MSSHFVYVHAVVEGKTEQTFIEKVLKGYLAAKNIFITASQISKPGQKGGDVKYSRAEKDIGHFLKQRPDIYITQFFDYYGLKEWPNKEQINRQSHTEIAQLLNDGALQALRGKFPDINVDERYIPFMAMHEFEALLFSDVAILAEAINVEANVIQTILDQCGEPETINNSRETAPSKRLDALKVGKFKKTVEGIAIAEQIGIDAIRKQCPLFNEWLNKLEALVK